MSKIHAMIVRKAGTAVDSEDTLLFHERNVITPMNEIYPFEEVQAAYDHDERQGALPRRAHDGGVAKARRRQLARRRMDELHDDLLHDDGADLRLRRADHPDRTVSSTG